MNEYHISHTRQVKHYLTNILKAMHAEIFGAIHTAPWQGTDLIAILHANTELAHLADALAVAIREGGNATPFYIRFAETDPNTVAGWQGGTIIVPKRLDWIAPLLDRAESEAEVEKIDDEIRRLIAIRDNARKAIGAEA